MTVLKRVGALRRGLRLLEKHEVTSFWGKTNWHQIFERLPPTFTARDLAALTGARRAWWARSRIGGDGSGGSSRSLVGSSGR